MAVGYVTTRTYRLEDGVLTAISTGGGAIQNLGFGYDGLGNLVSRTDASVSGGDLQGRGRDTAAHGVLGRQITPSDPDKGNWTYVDNALGQVVGQTDAKARLRDRPLWYVAVGVARPRRLHFSPFPPKAG